MTYNSELFPANRTVLETTNGWFRGSSCVKRLGKRGIRILIAILVVTPLLSGFLFFLCFELRLGRFGKLAFLRRFLFLFFIYIHGFIFNGISLRFVQLIRREA